MLPEQPPKAMEKTLTTVFHSPKVVQLLRAIKELSQRELTALSLEMLMAQLRAKHRNEKGAKNEGCLDRH